MALLTGQPKHSTFVNSSSYLYKEHSNDQQSYTLHWPFAYIKPQIYIPLLKEIRTLCNTETTVCIYFMFVYQTRDFAECLTYVFLENVWGLFIAKIIAAMHKVNIKEKKGNIENYKFCYT